MPKVTLPGRRGEIADLRIVARSRRAWSPREAPPRPPASARRSAPARRSGRAGRGTGCPGTPPAAGPAARSRETPPSSTSNRPSSAPRASSRVEATPETRFAPELLWASRTRGRRIAATNAAVVVLPFVAEIATGPGSRAASGRERRDRSWRGSCRAASCRRRGRRGARAGRRTGRGRPPGRGASGGQSSCAGAVCTLSNRSGSVYAGLCKWSRRSILFAQCRASVPTGPSPASIPPSWRRSRPRSAAATPTRRSSSSCATRRSGSGARRR